MLLTGHDKTNKAPILVNNWLFSFFQRRPRKSEMLFLPRLLKKNQNQKNAQEKTVLRIKNWTEIDHKCNPSSIFSTNPDKPILSYKAVFSYIHSWYAIHSVIFLDVIVRNSKNRSAKGNCKYNIMCGYKNWNPLFHEALQRRFEKSTLH